MKFIISTFSMSMILDKDFDLKIHKLTEEEFQVLSYDAYSCVGYEDVAKILNVAYNREAVKARVGDVLLLATLNKSGTMEFSCIQVCSSETPLLRQEELLIDEEMF